MGSIYGDFDRQKHKLKNSLYLDKYKQKRKLFKLSVKMRKYKKQSQRKKTNSNGVKIFSLRIKWIDDIFYFYTETPLILKVFRKCKTWIRWKGKANKYQRKSELNSLAEKIINFIKLKVKEKL